jgi:energy-coupling factor transporter ATP-binding protein EcfA2
MTRNNQIIGFGISQYRSFSDEVQMLGPFKRMNIFIGENNSGKSNVLRFIRKVYSHLKPSKVKLGEIDRPRNGKVLTEVPVLLKVDAESVARAFPQLAQRQDRDDLVRILSNGQNIPSYGRFLCQIDGSEQKHFMREFYDPKILDGSDRQGLQRLNRLWMDVLPKINGNAEEHWYPDIYRAYYNAIFSPVVPKYIPTLRRVPLRLKDFEDEYGAVSSEKSIIDDLASLAQPDYNNWEDRKRFDHLERFVQRVLKRPKLKLHIPHDKTTINIDDYGRYLPIEALGTGLHQVILLAAAAILETDAVVLIEEPELHLHPELQHQLMHFFLEATTNQYFVTTHSATIMDAVEADVYAVRLESGHSIIERPLDRGSRRKICHVLGYRPSDLLQANSLIWVEGPSDRIYLIAWLRQFAPDLEEGWHFSIVFYGGRLLSHISGDSEVVSDFISLQPINRFPAILMDSDKRNSRSQINDTKKRIIAEFESKQAFFWVTKGREIENYVARGAREAAVRSVHNAELAEVDDVYGHSISCVNKNGAITVDKLSIARHICSSDVDLCVLDLKERLEQLVLYIRSANRMAP